MNDYAYYFPNEPGFSISKAKRTDVHFVSDSHYHDTYEIYYLVSGTRRQFVNHTIYDMKKGDLILIPKGSIHKTAAIVKNQHTRYLINFSEDYTKSICSDMNLSSVDVVFGTTLISIPESRREYILNLLERIEEEFCENYSEKYTDAMIKSYLTELFVFILRYNNRKITDTVPESIPEKEIQLAARYIYENFDKKLTLSSVASFVHMSESYFSKKFKAVTGLNFSEYLISTRIKAADEMLLGTDKSISEIAETCGFSDPNYFGDVFKKHKGVSPRKYKKFKARI
ncbi:MAG: helix-turn-helix transcriptional regulator [Oscillospiraceae bacterium]|nr:helix-turn-helix transcriptional regulator [Oscillospiraceae bacterium]